MIRPVFDASAGDWALAAAALSGFLLLWPHLKSMPRPIIVLRAAMLALLALSFSKPAVQRTELSSDKPRVAVIVDRGPSMNGKDDAGAARLARAARWLSERRQALEQRAEIALFAAAGESKRLDWKELESLAPATAALEPAAALSDAAQGGRSVERVWLFSDGAFEPGPVVDEAVRRLGVPIDAFGVGPRKVKAGLSVASVESPDFVFLHGHFPVAVSVEAEQSAGTSMSLRLFQGDRLLEEKKLDILSPYEVLSATFSVPAESLGRQSYRIEAAAGAAKAARKNFGVEVIRQKYRIMYLAGRPSPEYSHLREHLKGDPNHELVSFVILRNPENLSPVADHELSLIPFPAAEIFVTSLFQFDLFILENFAYWRFNLPPAYLQNLKRFVQQGGALLVLGGSNAFTQGGYQGTALEEALPVKLWPSADDFVPGLFKAAVTAPENPLLQLGESPEAAAELWSQVPELDGFSRFASVVPGASVLLSHPTAKTGDGRALPLVAVREYGKGKVMLVGTDSTWRWKLGGGRNWKISSFYGRFWSRAVQYLTGSLELKKVKFSPLPERLPAREPAVLALHVFDEHFRPVPGGELDLRFTWKSPDGASRSPAFFEREPGVFQVELTDLADGRHQLRASARYRGQFWGEDTASFSWETPKGEAPLNRKNLKALADLSGGTYSDLDAADSAALLEGLSPVRENSVVRGRIAVWGRPIWLWLLLPLLLAEWTLRRRRGYL